MFAKRDKKPFTPDMIPAFADQIRKTGIWGFWKISAPMADDDDIIYPARAKRLDYEGELGIVLSKPARDVVAADFRDYVWGVTLMSDWSIRDVNEGGVLKFAMQKNFDTSVSLGPCIVVDDIDPTNAVVETFVNGERRQSYSTRDMVFSFGEYLEYLSRDLTLQPGDVITGGTAKGTAADSSALMADGSSSPELFLKPGDIIEVKSPGLGTLRNRIVAKAK
jgi:2-keto-4-pentenoate hydratase/2-oxohepta-3-ene-1,7-dioic acid hydratase in catechol pathway